MAEQSNSAPLRVLLEGKGQEWVDLPVDAAGLHATFERLGVQSPDDLRVAEVASPYESIGAVLAGETNMDALNTIAVLLSGLKDYEIDTAQAIAKMDLQEYGDNSMEILLNVLSTEDNFSGFDLVAAHNETELGRYWAREDNLDISSEAELAAYGRENIKDGGIFTDWGYIRCKFLPDILYDSENLPAECRIVEAALQLGTGQPDRTYPTVYRHPPEVAQQNDELAQYRESNRVNAACAQALDQAVHDCNYKLYHYDLNAAAKSVIEEYGAERVQWVLAQHLQKNDWDGRFSHNNKAWAKSFDIPENRFSIPVINTHPAILDGFISNVRKTVLEKEAIAAPAPEQSATASEYKYYSLRRPIDIGTIPREPKPEAIHNFDSKLFVENDAFSAWGSVIYKQPLTDKQVDDYELRAASTNPRGKMSVLESLKDNRKTAARSTPERTAPDKSGPAR